MMPFFRFFLLFLFIIFSVSIYANTMIGYKDIYYQVQRDDTTQVCEYDRKFVEQWCLPIDIDPLGLYVGFKQLLVYSSDSIQMIDTSQLTKTDKAD